ncbi:hypothetical protein Xbed_03089 [Xenorhabdus beddingii]|uniref:Uncharacterized protein n=1 Tax=Xenorhabdus beddingii TaxID=40578 RepID=A0A1Y2SL64_9GAMM|nr:hypothetical protein [Xenorhabdus beddingii]OTA18644.1 hypothetical protein Xbed_03089 [Xenorhabdus beddingii]
MCRKIPILEGEMTLGEFGRICFSDLTAQAAGKVMIKQGGDSIINIVSLPAHTTK